MRCGQQIASQSVTAHSVSLLASFISSLAPLPCSIINERQRGTRGKNNVEENTHTHSMSAAPLKCLHIFLKTHTICKNEAKQHITAGEKEKQKVRCMYDKCSNGEVEVDRNVKFEREHVLFFLQQSVLAEYQQLICIDLFFLSVSSQHESNTHTQTHTHRLRRLHAPWHA